MTAQKLNVLVVGSGGREHALYWLISQSPRANRVVCAPGNGGILSENRFKDIKETDFHGILELVRLCEIGLVVVGPEVPLAAGLVDVLHQHGVLVYGPTMAAAQLEWSKIFTKEVCHAMGIPTAKWQAAWTMQEAEQCAAAGLRVVKANGLCAGKGVTVAENQAEAIEAAYKLLVDQIFGKAGSVVLFEEKLTGRECSIMAICDGTNAILLPPARDHKRLREGDQGPNTGGMGAYAPVPDVSAHDLEYIKHTFFLRTLQHMANLGTPFHGTLYAGLMKTRDGYKLLEYNVRFGDPETQAIVPLIDHRRSDIVEYMLASIKPNGLASFGPIHLTGGSSVCTVLASEGYPNQPTTGRRIVGIGHHGAHLFHAGTDRRSQNLITSGGRVLGVIGTGSTLEAARQTSLAVAERVTFCGVQYRRDIGLEQPQAR
ncbi:MAG TPA: phosphoribosylamine--glycine ligase [Candidatus Paceibacterota bacterium]|nr:phosphoribosylamine--glycine ligase [Candidatus Paceibacterota bacterium]